MIIWLKTVHLIKKFLFILFLLCFTSLLPIYGFDGNTNHSLSVNRLNTANSYLNEEKDAYLEGYIQALVNANYYEFDIIVYVETGDVYLYNLPKNALFKDSIIAFVESVPSVKSVTEVSKIASQTVEKLEKIEVKPQVKGVWFPQQTVLYPPMIANPRATVYSVGYHVGDRVMGGKSVEVSLADSFPIFRWSDVLPWNGDLQIDIQAGVWSVFHMWVNRQDEMAELVNTDYLVGIPLSYAVDKWAFRLRMYHVSGHLGDEYIVYHPDVKRVNPSMEAIDFFTSYQFNKHIRVYGGLGWVFNSDVSYPITPPLYFEWGGEARFLGTQFSYHRLYGTPFAAVFFRNWQVNQWSLDATYMIGYEFSKLQGLGRKMRLFINYHNGYFQGQFFKERSAWGGAGFSWGF